ncbi:MAG: LysM peptidoglycan-binding domain-containing protein [Candidatus Omnitrophica bacterium]|nr:LysM peptidoglycan-binding domain-containing protein [Candidatus Omnitrophota bacterium]MDE2008993.1 LysM peptidoglycan-binding domain-containing protein [Candidatus Omnitrophota bacterium]MDE2214517.1 LysM peptidoglycan-binding domain-containing protein [Candidatus Omnitrophota bacterium]MDE2230835.1 LysM peptidoglycan-binding domain-containing protein [Candidatus Omnitrophota bacterium]
MLNKNLALVVMVLFAAGCGLEARTYVMTKPRVGLNRGTGNGGCVVGTCPPAPAPAETTRKVYVLEITKPVPESKVEKIEEQAINAIAQTAPQPSSETVPAAPAPTVNTQSSQPQVTVPVIGERPGTIATTPSTPAAATTPVEQNHGNLQPASYTVQKDDTLQKISKKVYGTYSKWYKIYKANKDKIKNPNVLRPGTVLTIPPVK